MSKVIIKKISDRKYISRPVFKPTVKSVSDSKFWQQLALKQQVLIHAKNNT
ncbi:MAG: hypothetical protein WAN61_02495 [Minisyncoccia bacterium]